VTRALAGLLGVAFALWFTTSLFNFEINPQGAIFARDVRVSDDTVSFDVSLFSTIGFLSDYSWKVEGDCLYVRFYESLLPEGPLLGPFTDSWVKRVSIDVGRPLNRVVAVGKGWESVVWERETPVHETSAQPSHGRVTAHPDIRANPSPPHDEPGCRPCVVSCARARVARDGS